MKSKYLSLLENTLTRYQRGGFLVGDYIKFADDYKSKPCYKDLTAQIKDAVAEVVELSKNMNLRVVSIKNEYPSRAPGNEFNTNGIVVIDVGLDYGGGRFYNVVTVPSDVLTRLDYGVNYAPLPQAIVRPNQITLKPELVEIDGKTETYRQTRTADQDGKDKDVEAELDDENVKIPASSAKSSVGAYLKYLK
jgi:hypothetical protein